MAEDDAASVRHGYDRWAPIYDRDGNPMQALEEPLVLAAVGDARGLRVLDLGCGTGRHALWLAAAGAGVTAVDFSGGMLAEARRKPGADEVRFLAHDLHEPLPFADGAFELVVSGLVLEHLRDLGGFFREARRVLQPGGRAVLSAMHPAMLLRDVQARFTDPETGEVIRPGSLPHQTGDFVGAAVRAGFRVDNLRERAPDAPFATRYPRAERFIGWPMVLLLELGTERYLRAGSTPEGQAMDEQLKHYSDKLDYEIDAADLQQSLDAREAVVVVDARSPEAYRREHIPGAINIPHGTMSAETTGRLDRETLVVTYCDGIGCNASTRGALNMLKLGFRVKELIGGLDWWKRDGHPTHGVEGSSVSERCGCG
jgi:malonyl-CoA O-methyltransferase